MKTVTQAAVAAMYAEAQSGANDDLTNAEIAFTEGAEAWSKCPVDGTRFFRRSDAYPLGSESEKFCSSACEALARIARRKAAIGQLPELPRDVADEVATEGEVGREEGYTDA